MERIDIMKKMAKMFGNPNFNYNLVEFLYLCSEEKIRAYRQQTELDIEKSDVLNEFKRRVSYIPEVTWK